MFEARSSDIVLIHVSTCLNISRFSKKNHRSLQRATRQRQSIRYMEWVWRVWHSIGESLSSLLALRDSKISNDELFMGFYFGDVGDV